MHVRAKMQTLKLILDNNFFMHTMTLHCSVRSAGQYQYSSTIFPPQLFIDANETTNETTLTKTADKVKTGQKNSLD